MKNELIYTIPGWGFSSHILSQGALAGKACFGLDYFCSNELSIEGIALELSKFIKKPSVLVAWSLGGVFAIKIASLFPGKVKKLILLASQPKLLADTGYSGINPKAVKAFIESAQGDFYELQKRFIAEVNFPNKNILYKNNLNTYFLEDFSETLKGLLKIFSVDLRDDYRHLRMEILHIIGGRDAILKQDEQCLRDMNGNITVAHMADAGHCCFLTHSKLCRSIINKFIL